MKRTTEIPNILFNKDNSVYQNYDKSYVDLIKKEQIFFANLIKRKYNKTTPNDKLVVLVYIHADFGKRQDNDYKVVIKDSPDYNKFKSTDDYTQVCTFNEALKNIS